MLLHEFINFILGRRKRKSGTTKKYHILFYCVFSTQKHLLCTGVCQINLFVSMNRTTFSEEGRKSALQGFTISINTRTVRSGWILFFTHGPWHEKSTDTLSSARTHTHTHLQPQSVFILSILYQYAFFPSIRETHTHTEAERTSERTLEIITYTPDSVWKHWKRCCFVFFYRDELN